MKKFLIAASLSALSVISIGSANAQTAAISLAALPGSDFAFCLATNASFVVSTQISTEVGVVVTNVGNSLTNTSGSVVVAANNFYKNGAGGEWTSNMGVFSLTGGNCYNIASMYKATSPNPSTPWTCAATSGAASGAGATVSGIVSTPTQVLPIATGFVTAGVTSTLSNAPVVNCPY